MFNPLKAVGKAVSKAPGLNKVASKVNSAPGMGVMGKALGPVNRGMGIGPSPAIAPQPPMGQAAGPNNAAALGQMAQAGANMMPQLQPKPMPEGGPPQGQMMPPDQGMGQVDPNVIMMAKQRAAAMGQSQMNPGQGLGPSAQLGMRRPMPVRGQFGAYRQ